MTFVKTQNPPRDQSKDKERLITRLADLPPDQVLKLQKEVAGAAGGGGEFTQGPTIGQLPPIGPPPCHIQDNLLNPFATAWDDTADWPSPAPVGSFPGTTGWVDPTNGDVVLLGNIDTTDAAAYLWRWPAGLAAFDAGTIIRADPPDANTSAIPEFIRWNLLGSFVVSGVEGVDIGGGDSVSQPWVNLNAASSSRLASGTNRDFLESNSALDSVGTIHTVANEIEKDAIGGFQDRYYLRYGAGSSSALSLALFDPNVGDGTIFSPRIFIDQSNDNMHVIFSYLGDVYYCKKEAGQPSFTTPIDTGINDIRTFGYNFLDVAALGNYVVIHSIHASNATYYITSEDAGDSWSAPLVWDTFSPADTNRDQAQLWANDCFLGIQRLYDDNFDPPRGLAWGLDVNLNPQQAVNESIDSFSSGSNGMKYFAGGLHNGDIVYLRRGTQWARRKHDIDILN